MEYDEKETRRFCEDQARRFAEKRAQEFAARGDFELVVMLPEQVRRPFMYDHYEVLKAKFWRSKHHVSERRVYITLWVGHKINYNGLGPNRISRETFRKPEPGEGEWKQVESIFIEKRWER